jgi:hypothetical protein
MRFFLAIRQKRRYKKENFCKLLRSMAFVKDISHNDMLDYTIISGGMENRKGHPAWRGRDNAMDFFRLQARLVLHEDKERTAGGRSPDNGIRREGRHVIFKQGPLPLVL